MKGRRKFRTDKWQLKAQVIKEARAILASRAVTSGRFLDIAAQSTLEEPVGLLAGSCGGSQFDENKRRVGQFKDT